MRWTSDEALELAASVGAPDPESAIRTCCRSLFDAIGDYKLPLALHQLFPQLEVRRVLVKEMMLEGALKRSPQGGFTILVRADRFETRRRFSIAHECGHVFFHRFAPLAKAAQARTGNPAPREEELLCNVAAEELLMPLPAATTTMDANGENLAAAVTTLARTCQVSLAAALVRVAALAKSRGSLQLWEFRDGRWRLGKAKRTGNARLSLDTFVPEPWLDSFPAAVSRQSSWEYSGWLYSRHRKEFAAAQSRSSRFSEGKLVVHHTLTKEPSRPTLPIEVARRARLKKAWATRPDPCCSACQGDGFVYVASRTMGLCRCRFAGAANAS